MITVDVSKYEISELKAMDLWIGENVANVRPPEPVPYRFDNKSGEKMLYVYFTYEEDELAFRLRFPIR